MLGSYLGPELVTDGRNAIFSGPSALDVQDRPCDRGSVARLRVRDVHAPRELAGPERGITMASPRIVAPRARDKRIDRLRR
jgi:hypothetical protein